MMGEDAYKLIYNLSSPTLPEERTYEKLTQLLDKFFASQKSVLAERYKFYESKKHEKESAKEWAARVRSMAVNCEFGAELEICLRDKFVCGFEKGPILDRMLEEKNEVSFDKMLDVASNKMAALENYKIPFIKEEPINHVRSQKEKRSQGQSGVRQGSDTFKENFEKCPRCGGRNHPKEGYAKDRTHSRKILRNARDVEEEIIPKISVFF
ncbi:hypothetical protein QE152_g32148 [Popillia japonica]|uniref:Retrotransposon gag domain-containing protein n=1 Tax=Popillia japonica TaxID=7064 RepID=A0AAW1J075_POPJA